MFRYQIAIVSRAKFCRLRCEGEEGKLRKASVLDMKCCRRAFVVCAIITRCRREPGGSNSTGMFLRRNVDDESRREKEPSDNGRRQWRNSGHEDIMILNSRYCELTIATKSATEHSRLRDQTLRRRRYNWNICSLSPGDNRDAGFVCDVGNPLRRSFRKPDRIPFRKPDRKPYRKPHRTTGGTPRPDSDRVF